MRNLASRILILAVAITAAHGCADTASTGSDLRIDLAMRGPVSASHEAVIADVTITNDSDQPVRLLSWWLPTSDLQESVFTITRDGQPVAFIGPHYKRMQPEAADFVELAPGAQMSWQVDLARFYDFSQTGDYSVKVAVGPATTSEVGAIWAEGRAAIIEKPVRDTCTAGEKQLIDDAITVAGQYSNAARDYLAGSPSATPRYTTWFGNFSTGGWNTVHNHFTSIAAAFATQPITVDCKCRQKNVYAYVYPDQPYKIFVCGAFWSAPTSGTDSKAGTLVHEMSHFNVTAGTDDFAYGQTACKALAQSNPSQAIGNADSHEYFAENTPAQP